MTDLKKLASQLGALNNEVKLRIITLLTEKGACSITDISKELKINFSTTHKYLEQLEKTGFLKSNTVLKNRLKRLFYVKDFDINISPKRLVDEKIQHYIPKKGLKIISQNGKVIKFNVEELAKKYIGFGVPIVTIEEGIRLIRERTYDGITILEIEDIFENFLRDKVLSLENSLRSISKLDPKKRTYADVLKILRPEALEMHKKGDIFIENLGAPKLLNFVHSLYGIASHGIGKKPKDLQESFQQILLAIKKVSKFTVGPQSFDFFNYFVASFPQSEKNQSLLRDFFMALNKIGVEFYIGFDMGTPKYISDKEHKNESIIKKVTKCIISELERGDYENIIPIFKLWDKSFLSTFNLKEFYVSDMTSTWQGDNASFVGGIRFDSSWRGVLRTNRIGELQNITINLPRIALKANSEKDFFEELEKIIQNCISFQLSMTELTMGEFLRSYEPFFESSDGRWNYVLTADSTYAISILGLNEVIKILTNEDLKDNLKLAKKILEFCNSLIMKKSLIRLSLREEHNEIVAKRFAFLDKKFENYSLGVENEDAITSMSLHENLLGGHNLRLSKSQYKNIVSKLSRIKFSMVRVK